MGILYVVGGPATGPGDLTLRARRILAGVALVVAGDPPEARHLLADLGISTRVEAASSPDLVVEALARNDVALLLSARSPVLMADEQVLVTAVLAAGFAAVPVPGPVVALTALVMSGLPADSFVYLGLLPEDPADRRSLLESMAVEARTLVLLTHPGDLPALLSLLHAVWGDRSLGLWPASPGGAPDMWRGSVAEALQAGESLAERDWVLVIGGAPEERELPWDEARLRGEIRAGLERGLGVGQVSRELAASSGWARREVYRLALEEGDSG